MSQTTLTNEYKEAIAETLDILYNSDKYIINKIPKKLIDFFEENKSQTYKSNLDYNQEITEMNLKPKTKSIISMLYLNYICDKDEKIKLRKKMEQNEKVYQEILSKKYSTENLFSKNKKIKNNIETDMIKTEESNFKKILIKIKKIFRI